MRIWLDDLRDPPDGSWTVCRTAHEAAKRIGFCTLISFDHDLGEDQPTGYDLAKYVYSRFTMGLPIPRWFRVHSSNPVGGDNITAILQGVCTPWEE